MAANKKSKKGKTIPLTDFLAAEPKLVTLRSNWSEIVDKEEEETKPIVVNIGILPTAPRGAVDIDYSTVPNTPPFVAHIANLSFEIDDEKLRRIFADLNPKSARVMREGNRSRGVGLVEFETRDTFIEALKKSDMEVYGRKIRVNVSDKTDSHHNEGNRGGFGSRPNRSNPGQEDRAETTERWKRAEPRQEEPFDDRSRGGFNRDRPNRGDFSRPNMSGGARDDQNRGDFGFGYPRQRDDRGGQGGAGGGSGGGGRDRDRDRDYNRPGQRNRYQDDDNRSNSGMDRPRYAGRYSDTRDVRDRNKSNDEPRDDQQDAPRERPRLALQPRTKPLDEPQPLSGSSSSVNNVAANAPESPVSHVEETPSSNKWTRRKQDSRSNEQPDEHEQQESHEPNGDNSAGNASDEPFVPKLSRGAGASIFGGAKPVDTTAKELEIEKKLKESQVTSTETTGDSEERGSSSRPSYNRPSDRDSYRGNRSSNNDDYHTRNRDRRDDDRSGHGGGFSQRRDHSGGRQYDDDNRRRNDDDHHRRGDGHDRDRYSGPSRRDNESGRPSKYNHHNQSDRDQDRGHARHNDRDDRNPESNDQNNLGRPSNNNFNNEPPSRIPPRGGARRIIPPDAETNKLQLSNKFGMLDVDDGGENDEAQSPGLDE